MEFIASASRPTRTCWRISGQSKKTNSATVQTTYTFVSDQNGRTASSEIGQIFELGSVGGRWVVVASSTR